ncbi:hypothetical protein [Umezawaea beigongshangensis]|uniref:hypothetical protein n=1 Tax=Umezawaea beigongshangensis TaxID=2780383 RepID=UPI0018F18EFD|nr:hypothetical protein [Umezawaea beigongshangensis]
MVVHISAEERKLRDLARALRSEEDGKAMRRDMVREMRAVLNPTRNAARAAIRAMPSNGHAGLKLRSVVASKVMVQIKPSGRFAGAALRAKKTPSVRKFRNAPKRLNARKGFTHPAINNPSARIHQMGRPGWFDDTTRRDRAKHKRAMAGVLRAAEQRITSKS